MKCPTCTEVALVMADRQGVEIDYCPQCRGVWLDRGELDKLIDRSVIVAPVLQQQPIQQPQQQNYTQQPAQRSEYKNSDYNQHGQHDKRKPKSWLSEIFD